MATSVTTIIRRLIIPAMIFGMVAAVLVTGVSVFRWMKQERQQPTTQMLTKQQIAALPSAPVTGNSLRELEAAFADIEREIARLRQAGQPDEAEKLAAQLKQFKDRLQGTYAPPDFSGAELHVVGFYEGAPRGGSGQGAKDYSTPVAEVNVSFAGKPIILVLCAYDRLNWKVKTGPEVKLEQIILGGYHKQKLIDPPADVPVLTHVYENKDADYFCAYKKDQEQFASAAKKLRKLTGLDVATFQGGYRSGAEPVVVGPESDDWRAQHILASMSEIHAVAMKFELARRAAESRKMKFQAIHFAAGGRSRVARAAGYGDFTAAGPIVESLTALPPNVSCLAIDPKGPKYYTISGHGVAELDLNAGKLMSFEVDDELPTLSWPCGLTFDTKRRRLLLASLGGVGYLYSFEPDRKRWSVLTDMANIDLCALTYAADEDCLYGVGMPRGSEGPIDTIRKFDPQGAPIGQLALSKPMQSAAHQQKVQIVAVGQQLVLLGSPYLDSNGREELAGHCLVVNRETGEVLYSNEYRSEPEDESVAEK